MNIAPVKEIYVGSTLIYPKPIDTLVDVTPDAPSLVPGVDQLFTCTATSANGPLTYQWRKRPTAEDEWTIIEGATGDTYNYTPVIEENGWTLSCQTRDKYDRQKAGAEVLTIAYPATTVSIVADDIDVVEGAVITFTATPGGGDGAYTYQWNLDGAPISGATSATYPRTTVLADNGKVITCTVTSAGSPATSTGLTMVVVAAYAPPTYVGNHRIANNGTTDVFTPSGLEVGGLIVAAINQRGSGSPPTFTAGATVIKRHDYNQRTVLVAEYTGGSCTITYTDDQDTQACMWYFNGATLGQTASLNNTNNGPAITMAKDGWVVNCYSWSGTENINPVTNPDWGNKLPSSTTWPNDCGMAKSALAGSVNDPAAWSGMGARSGVNATIEILGK